MKMGRRLRKKRKILDSRATPKASAASSPTVFRGESLKGKKVVKKVRSEKLIPSLSTIST
jgi:hypothetical protein